MSCPVNACRLLQARGRLAGVALSAALALALTGGAALAEEARGAGRDTLEAPPPPPPGAKVPTAGPEGPEELDEPPAPPPGAAVQAPPAVEEAPPPETEREPEGDAAVEEPGRPTQVRPDEEPGNAWAPTPSYTDPFGEPKRRRRSRGAIAVGVVLTSVSPLVSMGGGFVLGSGDEVGLPLLIGGLVGLGVGIPLIAYGAKKVPDTSPSASARPTVLVGPGSAAMRWVF